MFSVSITHNSKIRELSDGNRVIVYQTAFLLWVLLLLSYELWKLRIELPNLPIQTPPKQLPTFFFFLWRKCNYQLGLSQLGLYAYIYIYFAEWAICLYNEWFIIEGNKHWVSELGRERLWQNEWFLEWHLRFYFWNIWFCIIFYQWSLFDLSFFCYLWWVFLWFWTGLPLVILRSKCSG